MTHRIVNLNLKPKPEFTHNIGSLIRNPHNDTDYGVFIKKLNNNLFFFRLQDDHLPVFSKTDIIPNLVKTGTINDNNQELNNNNDNHEINNNDNNNNNNNNNNTNIDCAKLKRELLKYYRTRNLDKTEKILLSDIMTFAFPNGIPHYNTDVPLSKKEIIKTNLNNTLEEKNAFLIHTPLDSTLNHLNEKTSYIIEKTPSGVWIVKPSPNLEDSSFHYLFYNDKSLPNFGGISRMEHSPEKQLNEDTYNKLYDIFNKSSKLTELNYNGEIVKVEPETKSVLLPDLHKFKEYSPKLDKLLETEEYKKYNVNNNTQTNIELIDLNNDNDDEYHSPTTLEQQHQQCPAIMQGGGKSKKDIEVIEEMEEYDLEEENRRREYELFKEETEENQTSLKDTFDDYDRKMINLLQSNKSTKSKKTKSKSKSKTKTKTNKQANNDNNNSELDTDQETEGEEFDFEEFEFDEDEIEVVEVIEKQMIQEKEEKDKFYNENLQISELNKLFINQYPFLLRNNDLVINSVKKKVNNFMNIKNNIIMKPKLSDDEKQQQLELNPTHDTIRYRPLLNQYANGNLKNNLLIPLVIHKKKIYIDENTKYDSDNYNEQFVNLENFYNELNSFNYLMEYKKYNKNKKENEIYDYEKFNAQMRTILQPVDHNINFNETNGGDKFNIYNIKLGTLNKDIKEISISDIDSKHKNNNNILKNKYVSSVVNKDVMTISYCAKPFVCQSFNSSNDSTYFNTSFQETFKFVPLYDENKNIITKFSKNEKLLNNVQVYEPTPNENTAENINVIGFVRLPLNKIHTIKNSNSKYNIDIEKIYSTALEESTIKVIEISNSINISENDNKSLFFKHTNNTVIYLFTKDKSTSNASFLQSINSIIPTFDEIIDYYIDDIKKSNNNNLVYEIINLYGYSRKELNYEEKNTIDNIQNKLYEKETSYITNFFEDLKKNKRSKDDSKEKSIEFSIKNNIIEELMKISGKKYVEYKQEIDSDFVRYSWIKGVDEGIHFLTSNLLIEYYEKQHIDNYIQELDGYIQQTEKELSILKATSTDLNKATNSNKCDGIGLGNVKIVRYNSREALENDNGKEAVDREDNLITVGDIAILEEESDAKDGESKNKKKDTFVFKRSHINGTEMWIGETKQYLKNLIEEEKNKEHTLQLDQNHYDENKNMCHSIYSDYFNFDLDKPNCSFELDKETFKCQSLDLTINQSKITKKEDYLESLKDEKQYYNKLEVEKNLLEKDIKKTRTSILDKSRRQTSITKDLIEKYKIDTEILNKNLLIKKPCVHNNMLDYIGKIRNITPEELYKFHQILFNTYHNTDYILNLHEVNIDNLEKDDEDILKNKDGDMKYQKNQKIEFIKNQQNYTVCNICNQNLLCKHWLFGVKQLETKGEIDINEIVIIYGRENNGVYNCKICGEYLASTDTLDLVDIGRGDQGKVLGKRQVMEEDDNRINKINIIDDYLHQLEVDNKYDSDIYFRMEFYVYMKQFLNIKVRNEDEKEMILFIKTHEFIKKEALYAQYRKARGDLKIKHIHTLVITKFNKLVCVDIAARFLIILQTSRGEYTIKNNYCSSNYMGFPLINDVNENAGINMIQCMFRQLSLRQKYKFLEKGMEKIFIDRLFYFIENDEFVKNKINQAINDKAEWIYNVLNFDLYENNLWKDFLPHMKVALDWKPDKKLLKSELKEIKGSNYIKMYDVCRQNLFYMTYQIVFLINKVIDKEDVMNKFYKSTQISNSCCTDILNTVEDYYTYFKKKNKDIATIMDEMSRMNENKIYMNDKTEMLIHKIETTLNINKKLKILPLTFNMNEEEIMNYFLIFIDEGIHKGKQHVFNNYGICLLSNKLKSTIEDTKYSIHEFNKLRYIVYQKNIIKSGENESITNINSTKSTKSTKQYNIEDIESKSVIDFNVKENAVVLLDYILDVSKDHKKLSIFQNIIGSIKDNIQTNNTENNISVWGRLITQTNEDISSLIKGITNKKNEVNDLTKALISLGDYNQLYEQELEKGSASINANHFKYKKKETELKRNYDFLLNSILQIKHSKIKYVKRIENIRVQYQYLYPFKDENTLFEDMYKIVTLYRKVFKNIKGQKNSYITPENVSIIFHYLLIHSLLMILNNYNKTTDNTTSLSLNKVKSSMRKLKEYDNEDGGYMDGDDFNIVKEKKKPTKNTFYAKSSFLLLFIKYIVKNQEHFDNLTNSFILKERGIFDEKHKRRNLKFLQILKTQEGMEEYRNMVLSKLQHGMLQYDNLEKELDILGITQDDEYDNNIVEKDNIDDNEVYNKEKNPDSFMDINFTDGIIVYESDEEGAEDADFLVSEID